MCIILYIYYIINTIHHNPFQDRTTQDSTTTHNNPFQDKTGQPTTVQRQPTTVQRQPKTIKDNTGKLQSYAVA